ncbi:MAG: CDP-diacylglycerol--glycerol-3-phosphate 3-phosphatidyltransferase [Deltaproteobacteria bacterium]|jgi:CDP-diacylglycerol--glycerol-3-phosphate 3-phosphatidyltransferase|nr:CDP-diacylglycerol--glycerol-3-phosphate 3-phosphatidyltransferase [Deltaproteobacteria bacterium]
MILTAPNLLTLFRVATVPLLVCLLRYPGRLPSALAAGLFFFATISDYLDGYFARSYGSGTTLGKFLDPMADKILVSAALIMLSAVARWPRVPAWMVVVLVAREIFVMGLRAVAAIEGKVIAAEELGKYKTVLQLIAIHGLIIHYVYFYVDFFAVGIFILWISLALSLWSAVDYYLRAYEAFRAAGSSATARRAAV